MKQLFALFLLCGLFSCCSPAHKENDGSVKDSLELPANTAIIKNKAAVYTAFGTRHSSCGITAEEIRQAEVIMAEMVKIDPRIDLSKYTRQYVAATNEKGEKLVWINCFCSSSHFPEWEKEIVMVDDGGACFFNLKINLAKQKCYDFMVNGEA